MKAIGIIPVRYKATRFEGKVLADLGGQSVIQRVWERACQAKRLDEVLIACDDKRIETHAKDFGAKVVMTDPHHATGSDRVIEAAAKTKADCVVNIQGDEPFINPETIDILIEKLVQDEVAVAVTAVKRIATPAELENPNIVKVVFDHQGYALYFSRSPIPFNRDQQPLESIDFFRHLGIYAYQKDFLMQFSHLPESPLEKTEKLEQLRLLQAGYKILTVCTDQIALGIDTREDLEGARKFLNQGKG